jgi:hypothetical protein
MESTRIASTPLLGLRPLGSAADRSFERICGLMRTRVSEEAAALLAEPVITSDERRIDWYVQGAVDAKSMADLTPDERAGALAKIQQIRSQVETAAREMDGGTSAEKNIANALLNAVNVPGEDFIYLVNGQPVLVAWGFAKEDVVETRTVIGMRLPQQPAENPTTVVLSTPVAAATPVIVTTQTTSEAPWHTRLRWLPIALWTAFAILLGLLIWLLLTVCYFSIPFLGAVRNPIAITCSTNVSTGSAPRANAPTTTAPRTPEADRGAQLLQQLQDLEKQLQDRLRQCEPPQQAQPTQPTQESPQQAQQTPPPQAPDMQMRLDNARARSGSLQISLSWEGDADLDLYVICESGNIGANSRSGCGGGELDIDMNPMIAGNEAKFGSLTPVENIIWANPPPRGEYKIAVELYYRRTDKRPEIPFNIRIRRGTAEENLTGTISDLRQKKIIKVFTE